jgi:hypothetical protein
MKFTKVAHCWHLIEARKKLQLGDGFLESIPDHYTEEQAQNLRNFWRCRERLSFLRENLVRASNRENAKTIEVTPDYCFEIGEQQNWL